VGERFSSTWSDRTTWLSKGFGVPIAGTTAYQDLDTAIQVRNAVAHGDEQLTDLQTRTVAKTLILRRNIRKVLQIDAIGRLRYGTETPVRAESLARSFVLYFDEALLSEYPELRRF